MFYNEICLNFGRLLLLRVVEAVESLLLFSGTLVFIRVYIMAENNNKSKPIYRYICIDLKSYYASVECVYKHLAPLTANLLVADESRSDQTICLAVSPSLKAIGVPSRPRLFEARQAIKKYESTHHTKVYYIIAMPRMAEYIRISALIYSVYLRFLVPEDIHIMI